MPKIFGIVFKNNSLSNVNFAMTKLKNKRVIKNFHIFDILK